MPAPLEEIAQDEQRIKELKGEIAQLEAQKTNIVNEMNEYTQPKKEEADKIIADAQEQAAGILSEADKVKRANDSQMDIVNAAREQLAAEQESLKHDRDTLLTLTATYDQTLAEFEADCTTRNAALDAREAKARDREAVLSDREKAAGLREVNVLERETELEAKANRIQIDMAALDKKKEETAKAVEDAGSIIAAAGDAQEAAKVATEAADKRSAELDARETAVGARELAVGVREDEVTKKEKENADRTVALDAQAKANQEQTDANTDTLNLISVRNSELDKKIRTLNDLRDAKQ